MIFLLVALQVQQHEVLFGRVAALQCSVLFASRVSLREHEVLFASLKRTNYNFSIFSVLSVFSAVIEPGLNYAKKGNTGTVFSAFSVVQLCIRRWRNFGT